MGGYGSRPWSLLCQSVCGRFDFLSVFLLALHRRTGFKLLWLSLSIFASIHPTVSWLIVFSFLEYGILSPSAAETLYLPIYQQRLRARWPVSCLFVYHSANRYRRLELCLPDFLGFPCDMCVRHAKCMSLGAGNRWNSRRSYRIKIPNRRKSSKGPGRVGGRIQLYNKYLYMQACPHRGVWCSDSIH